MTPTRRSPVILWGAGGNGEVNSELPAHSSIRGSVLSVLCFRLGPSKPQDRVKDRTAARWSWASAKGERLPLLSPRRRRARVRVARERERERQRGEEEAEEEEERVLMPSERCAMEA